MFARVRTSLMLWNLLIISVILLAAGTITYLSQRQSLLANVDSVLLQAAADRPGLLLSNGPTEASLDQPVPFSLVVDTRGHVLADPGRLGVREVTLPRPGGVTLGGRLNIGWDQGVRIRAVQPEKKLFYLRGTSTGIVQELLVRPVPAGHDATYVQLIGSGTIQGQPVRLLIQPVLVDSTPTPIDPTTSAGAPGGLPARAQDAQPNGYLVTGISLAPMEQSLHQTLVVLLIGAAAGVLLSLL